MFAENLAAEENALEVDANDPIEFVLADVKKGRRRIDAGAIDDNIDAARSLQDSVEETLDVGLAGRFSSVKPGVSTIALDCRDTRTSLFLVAADNDDFCSRHSRGLRPSPHITRPCRQ